MINISLASIKKIYFKNKLKFLELTFLSLFLAFLPSFEAPKNIFLASYLITALYRQSQLPSSKWTIWDWVFLSLIASSFLSALFPFMAEGSEWKGFRGMLLWITFGWTLFRSDYNFKEKKYLFIFSIITTVPPLIWGLAELLILHTKDEFQLHSVGHVNHSAIYICMIIGAIFAILINTPATIKKINIFFLVLFTFFSQTVLNETESRAAFGIATAIIFFMVFSSRLSIKNKMMFFSMIIIIIAGSFFTNFTFRTITDQTTQMNRNDIFGVGERRKIWNTAFEVVKMHPLLGIGNGNWSHVEIDQIKSSIESRGEIFDTEEFTVKHPHPHNIYLSNLVDRGILGFIIFLNFMLIWLITLIKSYKRFNQDSKAMLFIMGSFSAWVTIFGIGFVNTTFHHENALLALFFLGLHLNYLRQKNQLKLFN